MSSKLESDVCYRVYGWHHLVKATEITASLAESNGSPPPGGWLKVTCRLTACTPGSAPSPSSVTSAGELTFTFLYQSIKIYFLSNRNITVYTVYASAQKAAREAYAH